MNKDQIMRAVEGASDEQLEKIAAIVGTEPTQVPVTGRHVGCVVRVVTNPGEVDQISGPDLLIDRKDNGYTETISVSGYALSVSFPEAYRVPITHRWSGGEQPVADGVPVLVQFGDGTFALRQKKNQLAGDIVGYTVLDVIGVGDE